MNTNTLRKSDDEATNVYAALASLTETVNTKTAEVKAANDNFKSRLDDLELRFNRPGVAANDNTPLTLEAKAFDQFIRHGQAALAPHEAKALRTSDNAAGGYLVPDTFQAEFDRNIVLFSPIRSVARVLPASGPAILWPKRTGGMTASWVGETSARPATNVTFGQSRYEVRELAAYVDVSNQLLEDTAFDVAAMLNYEFAEEFGYEEGKAFVNGNSVLSPSGFMQDSSVAYTASGSSSAITADGLIDLYHSIKTPYRANAVFGMNSNTLSAIRKLKDTTGNYLLAMAGIANAPVTTLLGRPVIEFPDMPDIGTSTYPVVFGDFSNAYRIFDRVSLAIMRDPFTQATTGVTRFHARRRVAGGIGKAEAINKLKIATS
ncbi:HK97 family phage major capsid protein [Bradyrhizobium sp. AZCC 1578]|uniref:phage major capsid protein n=1 Tax=Bradyrhizobium sp. AZCC 1578 TaxID=3117027 RepID=UPI002FEED9C6